MHLFCRFVAAIEETAPRSECGSFAHDLASFLQYGNIKSLTLHSHRHFVYARQVFTLDYTLTVNIAEIGHLAQNTVVKMFLGAQDEHIGLYSHALQFLHRMLGGLCLQLSGSLKIRHISKVYVYRILSKFPFQLPYCLHEGCTFNIANRAAYLGNHIVIMIFLPEQFHVALYLVGNVGHHLYGFAEIVATAFLVDYRLVYAASRERICLSGLNAGKPLVMSKVEVGFHTVHRNIAFSMLIGVKRTRVDVYVRIEFLNSDVVASCLQEFTYRRRYNTFSK